MKVGCRKKSDKILQYLHLFTRAEGIPASLYHIFKLFQGFHAPFQAISLILWAYERGCFPIHLQQMLFCVAMAVIDAIKAARPSGRAAFCVCCAERWCGPSCGTRCAPCRQSGCVAHRPRRNKSICLFCHRQRKLIYSHSMVPMGLGVRSSRTRLMPSASWVIR